VVLAHIFFFIWHARFLFKFLPLTISCSMVSEEKQFQASLIFPVQMVATGPGASRTTLYDLVLALDVDS
jgi:hypothetical protein